MGQLLIEAVTPAALEVALSVQQETQARLEETDRSRRMHVEPVGDSLRYSGWPALLHQNVQGKQDRKGPKVCAPIGRATLPGIDLSAYQQKVLWVAEDIDRGRARHARLDGPQPALRPVRCEGAVSTGRSGRIDRAGDARERARQRRNAFLVIHLGWRGLILPTEGVREKTAAISILAKQRSNA
ncbi:MAG: hypothetical protein R3F44_19235 [Candidatus Competibacteraceae bacterium]